MSRSPRRGRWPLAIVLGSIGALLACSADATAPRVTNDPARLFTSLVLNHHAVILSATAPYNTMQLTATAYDGTGAVLPDTGLTEGEELFFSSSAKDKLQVDSLTGELHAIGAASNIQITVTQVRNNVRQSDVAYVTVTSVAVPPVIDSLSIQPSGSDSATWAVRDVVGRLADKRITARAKDTDNNTLGGLVVYYTSSDTTVATINPTTGALRGVSAGETTIYATTTAYGVTKTDSVRYVIGPPIYGEVSVTSPPYAFGPSVDTISTGGVVKWKNGTTGSLDIVFDDPTNVLVDPLCTLNCGAGNIEPFLATDSVEECGKLSCSWSSVPAERTRKFQVEGVYPYHSTVTQKAGQIVVISTPRREP